MKAFLVVRKGSEVELIDADVNAAPIRQKYKAAVINGGDYDEVFMAVVVKRQRIRKHGVELKADAPRKRAASRKSGETVDAQ